MILTDLKNFRCIENSHPRFKTAFRWLVENDLSKYPKGRVEIDGQDCFALFDEGTGYDPATRRLESHLVYLDIQVNISGGERILVTPVEGLSVAEAFKPGVDLAFYHLPQRELTDVVLMPNMAAIFYPEDAHMPCIQLHQGPQAFRKLVMKVRL